MNYQNIFVDGQTLENAIDSGEFQILFDNMFSDLFEIDLEDLSPAPYWLEPYHNQEQDFMVQYIPHMWEGLKYGDVESFDGQDYVYVDSIKLDEEIEHQAETGELVYEYRGASFLRVWEPVQ